MFHSARSKLPDLDYVSLVSSLYKDKMALSIGTIASAIAAAVSGLNADAQIHYIFSTLFVMLALGRYHEAVKFEEKKPGLLDVKEAEHWELRATVFGSMAAILFGSWCFVSLVYLKNDFAILTSICVSIAAMVGVVARNYGLDRLVTIQLALVGIPLCLGLTLDGNIYHIVLAALFALMFISYRALASDIRNVLLSAVRDRVEVSRLAGELDMALSTMSHGLLMLDREMHIVVANEKMQEMLCGRADYSCMGRNFSSLINQSMSNGLVSELSAQRLTTAVANVGQSKLILQLLDGRQCEVSINRNNLQTVLVLEDITERMQSESRIKFMARYDPATNLPNRAYFSEQVASRLHSLQEGAEPSEVAFLSIDIDDFKYINDTYGHPMGDRVLTHISRCLRQSLDSSVSVGRFGGDEFAVFCDQNISAERMKGAANALLEVLAQPFVLDDYQLEIQVSAGLVINSSDSCDLEQLLQRADLALYDAKKNGKGKCSLYTNDMCQAYSDKQHLKSALREAIDTGGLMLAFQPVVDMETRKVVGCEALARWHHPELGNIPPDVFIPLAEEMGAISQITDWVLHTATKECVTWPGNVGLAVNISAWDFRGDNVQKMVYSALQQSGLSPERLEIEVTETVLVEELEVASKALGEVACQGVGIALDDFGTGYSSLGYLHDLPFSKLKVDRTFTQDVTNDPRALKLMRNIAVLGRDLNMKITVEGVETEEQLDVIARIGLVNSVQGYLFGAPVPQSEICQLICTLSGIEHKCHSDRGTGYLTLNQTVS